MRSNHRIRCDVVLWGVGRASSGHLVIFCSRPAAVPVPWYQLPDGACDAVIYHRTLVVKTEHTHTLIYCKEMFICFKFNKKLLVISEWNRTSNRKNVNCVHWWIDWIVKVAWRQFISYTNSWYYLLCFLNQITRLIQLICRSFICRGRFLHSYTYGLSLIIP